jgi:tRNA-dihydrouridine synthase 2
VLANGDCFAPEDFARVRAATGASSVMVARGAMWRAHRACREENHEQGL